MTLKEFLFGPKPISDRQEAKVMLHNKRMDLLRQKGDTIMGLPVARKQVEYYKHRIKKLEDEGNLTGNKYTEAKGDLASWEEEVEKFVSNLKQQDAAFRLIDDKYNNIDAFLKELTEDVYL